MELLVATKLRVGVVNPSTKPAKGLTPVTPDKPSSAPACTPRVIESGNPTPTGACVVSEKSAPGRGCAASFDAQVAEPAFGENRSTPENKGRLCNVAGVFNTRACGPDFFGQFRAEVSAEAPWPKVWLRAATGPQVTLYRAS
jgi:hypothetical protein